jgi:hypothetical protein
VVAELLRNRAWIYEQIRAASDTLSWPRAKTAPPATSSPYPHRPSLVGSSLGPLTTAMSPRCRS